jgi:hypothetical protein
MVSALTAKHLCTILFSTLQFFRKKVFGNFWYASGTPSQLVSYLQKKRLTVPEIFLHQLGYLSLRPGNSERHYVQDYPNTAGKISLAKSVLKSDFKSSSEANLVLRQVKEALTMRAPDMLVREFNKLLSELSYSYFPPKQSKQSEAETPGAPETREKLIEGFYSGKIFTLFYAIGLEQQAEKQGYLGRSDFVVRYGGNTWVIEVKVNHPKKAIKHWRTLPWSRSRNKITPGAVIIQFYWESASGGG